MSNKLSIRRPSTVLKRRRTARSEAKRSIRCRTVVVLGATKCGKTSFLRRLLFNQFTEEYTPTLEDSYKKSHKHNNYELNIEYVDTCGPFEYPGMFDMNVRRAQVRVQ